MQTLLMGDDLLILWMDCNLYNVDDDAVQIYSVMYNEGINTDQ
jgi:hypothetical protein